MLGYYLVSILVLVDAALEVVLVSIIINCYLSFNPCFSGCGSRSIKAIKTMEIIGGFNPCFSGCGSRRLVTYLLLRLSPVSILVLVDAALEVRYPILRHLSCLVSILVLVDAALEVQEQQKS